jgi:hypothetical protein
MENAMAVTTPHRKPAANPQRMRRLLIPVKDAKSAVSSVMYAIRLRAEALSVAVCLLHVEESPARWQELLGGTRIHGARRLRNKAVFGPALQLLDGLDIEFAAYVRTGPVVFSILDAAEELECDEIVVPAPGSALSHLLSRHVVTILAARQRAARLVAVTKSGIAVP